MDRDHLFVSYATEDWALAEWLTLRLTAEGYRVWCDRFQLLGGESYPRDIDEAIKRRTFRVLGLLSRSSLGKENPRKERTLGLNIGRERGIDFLIPINVDGLRATELDWMTSDLTYVPFHQGWQAGMAQLLKKLASVAAPRDISVGRSTVIDWYAAQAQPAKKEEQLWSNLFPLQGLPTHIIRSEFDEDLQEQALTWPAVTSSARVAWSFAPLSGAPRHASKLIEWDDPQGYLGVRTSDIVVQVIRKLVRLLLEDKGLITDERERQYFPPSLADRLDLVDAVGKDTYIRPTGQRMIKHLDGTRTPINHHLSPRLQPVLFRFGHPVVRIEPGVVMSDVNGNVLTNRLNARRARKVRRAWFNRQWLNRILAIAQWMADGATSVEIGKTYEGTLFMECRPLCFRVDFGINEPSRRSLRTDDSEYPDDDGADVVDEEWEEEEEEIDQTED